jgi:hypothetical protein
MSRVQTFDTSMIKKKKENMTAGTIICTAIRSALASDNNAALQTEQRLYRLVLVIFVTLQTLSSTGWPQNRHISDLISLPLS